MIVPSVEAVGPKKFALESDTNEANDPPVILPISHIELAVACRETNTPDPMAGPGTRTAVPPEKKAETVPVGVADFRSVPVPFATSMRICVLLTTEKLKPVELPIENVVIPVPSRLQTP